MDAQKRIKELMAERNWTEYRLAKEAGLSQTTVSNLFRRNNAPSLSTLESICKAFGISLSQFFSDESMVSVELTKEQQDFLKSWNSLNPEKKQVLTELINVIQG